MPDAQPTPGLLGELTRIMRRADAGLDHTARDVLQLGMDRLGLTIGIMARIADQDYTVVQAITPDGMDIEPGQRFDLCDTYCREVVRTGKPVAFHDIRQTPMAEHHA